MTRFEKILILLPVSAGLGLAQTLDTAILGTVTDPSGAVIPSASVTIAQPVTGQPTRSPPVTVVRTRCVICFPASTRLRSARRDSKPSVAPVWSSRRDKRRGSTSASDWAQWRNEQT